MSFGVNFETLTLPRIRLALLLLFAVLYTLEGHWLNPFILWNAIPLFVSYFIAGVAIKAESLKQLWGAVGFMSLSGLLLLIAHLAWFFDVQGTQTGSSTSALIFVIMPVYALVFGVVGYFAGTFSAKSRGIS